MSDVVSDILKDIELPRMVQVRQIFKDAHIEKTDIPALVTQQLHDNGCANRIKPGDKIAITVGSRYISNISLITKSIVDFVKTHGGKPFIIPSMGSHGGATAEGQLAIVTKYGITEGYCQCPVLSNMDVEEIGETPEGHKVFIDKLAAAADGIIICNRIKAHTNYFGPFESGIMKMMVIGLGNDYATTRYHELGTFSFTNLIPSLGKVILQNAPIIGCLAILDNAYHNTYKLEAMSPEMVEKREPELLLKAKKVMPRLFFKDYDVLVVDQIGKDISGAGMDPHITGTFCNETLCQQSGVARAKNIALLDLSEKTCGNAYGTGDASAITMRLWEKIDLAAGYPNGIISNCLESSKIPVIMRNDVDAIRVCIKCIPCLDRQNVKMIRIKDTLHVSDILISEALIAEIEDHPGLEIISEPFHMKFDKNGNLF